ncbi:hypothetical protein BMS3Bbin10_02374 [bacterium BMS3Bbin10]|nr:hypothetical protein BMS3Bbin10_02374 [bacterium BMS3Bbin10]
MSVSPGPPRNWMVLLVPGVMKSSARAVNILSWVLLRSMISIFSALLLMVAVLMSRSPSIWIVSIPSPPSNTQPLSCEIIRVSLPSPPLTMSAPPPGPMVMVSSPPSALIVSAPPRPSMMSTPEVPVRILSPASPVMMFGPLAAGGPPVPPGGGLLPVLFVFDPGGGGPGGAGSPSGAGGGRLPGGGVLPPSAPGCPVFRPLLGGAFGIELVTSPGSPCCCC